MAIGVRERDATRRRVILDAALACFLQYGYAKTSLDDIAQRAGISRPLLYRKFKNKEDIFGACYDDVFASRYPRCGAVLASRAGKKAKLKQICEIACLEPWAILWKAPAAAEFYAACMSVIPEIHDKHEKRFVEVVNEVIGDKEVAHVFNLALDGMFVDLPSVATLRKRIYLLIDRFL
jgi:AcrR family transcriptional regulator